MWPIKCEEHGRLDDSVEATTPTTPLEQDEDAPEWMATDWTVWQRKRAVVGFFLVATSCGLLAGALDEWNIVRLVPIVIAPIAMTLLCLGIGLLDWVFWYPYQQAGFRPNPTNSHPERMASFMRLAVGVAAWTLGAQLVLAAWASSPDWRGFSAAAYLLPCVIGFAAFGGTLAFAGRLGWTPGRVSNTSSDGWTPTPRGVRLLLRWLGLMAATRGGILFLGADDDPRRWRFPADYREQPAISTASDRSISDRCGGLLCAHHTERGVLLDDIALTVAPARC